MVAVVDKKNKKKYKAIKVEEQEDVKKRKYNQTSIFKIQSTFETTYYLPFKIFC